MGEVVDPGGKGRGDVKVRPALPAPTAPGEGSDGSKRMSRVPRVPSARPGLTYLQHEGGKEVEGGDPQQQQLEIQVVNALQLQQGFGEAQRVEGQPYHEAKKEDEDYQEEH